MGPQNCWPTNIPKIFSGASAPNPHILGALPPNPKVGERVYSTTGVQTRVNNISGFGRSGSTTNSDDVEAQECEDNNDENIPFAMWRSRVRGASS